MTTNSDQSQVIKAREFFQKAYQLHMYGQIHQAIDFYSQSIDCHPTAEAHTFRGWAYSHTGNYDKAIEECMTAIQLDANYGNAYNDIGSYLIEIGMHNDAERWLLKAIELPDYSTPHFAFYNLGRVYERQGKWFEAIKEYKKAYNTDPKFLVAATASIRLQARLN